MPRPTLNGEFRRWIQAEDWHDRLPAHLAEIATLLIPPRRERTCPRAVKRARHNSYRVKKPGEPASARHRAPATINIRRLQSRSAA